MCDCITNFSLIQLFDSRYQVTHLPRLQGSFGFLFRVKGAEFFHYKFIICGHHGYFIAHLEYSMLNFNQDNDTAKRIVPGIE